MKSWHLQDCSCHIRRLRTDGLALMSKYWAYWSHAAVMGPVNLVVDHQQNVDFAPIASMVGSGERLGTVSWIGQPSCCGLGREPFFSEAVALLNFIDDYVKVCYTWTTWDTYGRGSYVDRVWKTCDVLVGFFFVGCISIQIVVTLRYEYHLFVTVIT
jgi:hypothetical protein